MIRILREDVRLRCQMYFVDVKFVTQNLEIMALNCNFVD